jgi:hypothetical protein
VGAPARAAGGAALGSGDKVEAQRLNDEMNRVADALRKRGWIHQQDPSKPRLREWIPPFGGS